VQSQRQLRKLVRVGLQIQTKADLSEKLNKQVTVRGNPYEEKASILIECFGRKTSVVYDVQGIHELLTQEEGEDGVQEKSLLAHLFHKSIKAMSDWASAPKQLGLSLKTYFERAQ